MSAMSSQTLHLTSIFRQQTRCLLHLGIAKAVKRPLLVPDIMSALVDRHKAFHEVDYFSTSNNDPSTIVPKYRNAWWNDREPSPLPIQELENMWTRDAGFHLSQVNSLNAKLIVDIIDSSIFSWKEQGSHDKSTPTMSSYFPLRTCVDCRIGKLNQKLWLMLFLEIIFMTC
jgi:hypothetical protein